MRSGSACKLNKDQGRQSGWLVVGTLYVIVVTY